MLKIAKQAIYNKVKLNHNNIRMNNIFVIIS